MIPTNPHSRQRISSQAKTGKQRRKSPCNKFKYRNQRRKQIFRSHTEYNPISIPESQTSDLQPASRPPNQAQIFDCGSELSKSFVRELFILQSWLIDGICAALLHIGQTSRIDNYMALRRKRITDSGSADKSKTQVTSLKNERLQSIQIDKFLRLYLNKGQSTQ